MDRQINIRTVEIWTNGQKDGWTNRQNNRWTNRQKDR